MEPRGVARRNLLQAGALTSGLALVGLGPRAALAEPVGGTAAPFEGLLLAHVRLDCRRGASISITQLDRSRQPVRELATAQVALSALGGMNQLCERARRMAVLSAARQWRVPIAQCGAGPERIVHPASGRSIAYRAWVDVI
jgi:hypothetical protein